MDVEQLKAEARATAAKHLINMLQRPGQLEKVEQYKRHVSRSKASVEAMLNTAMQSQLDGVKVGINQPQTALNDIKTIKEDLNWIEQSFVAVPELHSQLQVVCDENMKHSQYVTAMESLKHIFTVRERVEKTKQCMLNEGKLLYTHQSLSDLENSRDDLLHVLHKLPNQAPADKSILETYFQNVEELSNLLEKQIRLILSRTLNTVRKDPTVIVTALRIIEREERADSFALQRQKQSGFLAPGRPKKWREKALDVLEKSVAQRIEGTQVDERDDNKMWLVRYLELTRQLILEDLRVVKKLCVPCFPPQWDILNTYVHMYHKCLSRHLQELISNGLEGNEYVSILSWIMNTYVGPELLQHPELNIQSVEPLLNNAIVEDLQQKYLSNMQRNYIDWMQKTLDTEKADWNSGALLEVGDQEEYYHTDVPVIVFQMIDQYLQVTRTISQDLTFRALIISMEHVTQYGKMYGEAVVEFKKKHFEDRSQMPYFTQYMITIANNCLHFVELAEQMKQHYWLPGVRDDEGGMKFEALLNTFQQLRDDAAQYLLDEVFLDLDSHFRSLLTPRWVGKSEAVDTICVTLDDYFVDYSHLRPRNFDHVLSETKNLVAKRYISAMLHKKLSFKSYEERRECAIKIIKEANQLKGFFVRIAPKLSKFDSPFDIIVNLAELLKIQDPEILLLDLHGLVDKYPDVTKDQLVEVLSLRGDISRSECVEKVSYIFQTNSSRQRASVPKTIFSQLN